MALPLFSRLCVGAFALASLSPSAQAQTLSDKEGYDSLLSCAAFFSAAAAVTEDDKQTSDQATELATAFMTGAVLLAPGSDSARAEKALEEQAQIFAVAMISDDKAMTKDLEGLADSCGTLGESYLPEVIARAGQ
ncbi:hypothetical protein C7451_10946 [Blastomonas natatoria]|uniref:Uncharacterized protein n=1 Tax=Blastomonas natatoria TaxID=34015 RepID=A0A2V3UWV7_9SPHN|nr:hypothetical protein [Blastomonas natatoria]PXW73760.1 hypothetical protein C7451_10946 [Blastomonas natatoria]